MIYLNNAATSFPKPEAVINAVNECMSHPVLHSKRSVIERDKEDKIFGTRLLISQLLGVKDPLDIIFTSGSTESLNLAIKGLNLKGSHVITTVIEHNSVLRPLKHLEKDEHLTIDFVGCDKYGYINPKDFEKYFHSNTRLVVVNHCSNVTGSINNIKEIAELAHYHGALILVDASQSAGAVPIDFDGWDIDLLAFTGHKSLFGLQGIGGLVIKKGIELNPLKVGGTGIFSESLLQPKGMPIFYEAGTQNTAGIISLYAGAKFIHDTGFETISNHKKRLFEILTRELRNIENLKVYSGGERHNHSNFCFNIGEMVPEEVGYILDSTFDIVVRTGYHCAPLLQKPLGVHPFGTVRASISYFTTEDEVLYFTDSIKQISSMRL